MLAFFSFIFYRACTSISGSSEAYYIEQAQQLIDPNVSSSQAQKSASATLILKDMHYKSNRYWHMYDIIGYYPSGTQKGQVFHKTSAWKEVNSTYFKKHIKNMGLELMHYNDTTQKTKQIVAPAGFSQFVGNALFGQWKVSKDVLDFSSSAPSTSTSVSLVDAKDWEFKPQYKELQTWLSSYIKKYDYKEVTNYRRNYMPSGIYYYGGYYPPTYYSSRGMSQPHRYSTDTYSGKTTSTWHKNSSTFRQQVQERLNRSKTSSSYRSSHSSNRYYGSSTRSSSGGYGK